MRKLHRKQVLNVLYQVCVFRAALSSKMAALASDWLKYFFTSSPQTLKGINIMVETLFVKDWLDTYYDELKELLSDKKELEDSSLWILARKTVSISI